MKTIPVLVLALAMTAGCMTPPPQGQVSSAAYVGDRSAVALDEIVVFLPSQGENPGIRNLHLLFVAIINPVTTSTADERDAHEIVRRAHARIAAELVAGIADGKMDAGKGLAGLRAQLQHKAQATFDPIYAKWAHANDLRVELVLTSLFITDGSVGRSRSNGFWWP